MENVLFQASYDSDLAAFSMAAAIDQTNTRSGKHGSLAAVTISIAAR